MTCHRPDAARRALWPVRVAALLVLLAGLMAGLMAAGRAAADAVPLDIAASDALTDRLADGTAHALIVGISEYDNPAWPRLGGVPTEVARVAAAFGAQGFAVQVARDDGRLTKGELRQVVQGFVTAHGGDERNRLVIYFATHGTKEAGGYGLLAASDTRAPGDAGFAGSAYSVRELSSDLTGMKAQHVFLFINACFSGAMLPAMGPTTRGGGDGEDALDEATSTMALRLLQAQARVVLTAGSDDQEVPDRDNPFADAVVGGLAGDADLDGDGLILGTEMAQHVRTSVALATLAKGRPNDPVFALLPQGDAPSPEGLRGDFVFLSPQGASKVVDLSDDALLAARSARLPPGQFTECADCPVMVALPAPGGGDPALAIGRTEVSYAEWDACYREFGCRRYLQDGGLGRGDRPVGGVGWQDALEFTEWVNAQRGQRCTRYRLPTLAEWQAAAGPPDPGAALCRDCGRAGGVSARAPGRAGALPGNGFGLHDMAGSLWEWVQGPEAACGFDVLIGSERCAQDGTVVGGAYSTRATALEGATAGAAFPRTGHSVPSALPSLGLRLVCDLAGKGG